MIVYQNVAFGLLGLLRHEVKARVAEMLAQLGIDDLTVVTPVSSLAGRLVASRWRARW